MDAFGIHRDLVADYQRYTEGFVDPSDARIRERLQQQSAAGRQWPHPWLSQPASFDPARREVIRAELDAAFFHLYGIERDDVDYIMETFPIVKCKDEAAHGEYCTKRLILENYDQLQRCIDTGTAFVSTLTPPPGAGPRHPERSTDV
ncbi:hypothetical protein [Microbacterium sp.]|uniref:hypothetical protein n=1 Tax=Microbacterium sp. TaxID=51671 RepID=UPI003C765DAF